MEPIHGAQRSDRLRGGDNNNPEPLKLYSYRSSLGEQFKNPFRTLCLGRRVRRRRGARLTVSKILYDIPRDLNTGRTQFELSTNYWRLVYRPPSGLLFDLVLFINQFVFDDGSRDRESNNSHGVHLLFWFVLLIIIIIILTVENVNLGSKTLCERHVTE